MIPEGWQRKTVGELCDFSNGNGFKPSDWSADGLPIIRIQNLNGEKSFNYYSGEVRGKWLVEPGQLLFAWAGTKGVSFGPKIWRGPLGVLNQHIFKVEPLEGVAKEWLYEALVHVTDVIEKKAHGFKATLLHVQKSDITEQVVPLPPLHEQKRIAQTLATWDEAITVTERLVEASQQQKSALMQQLLTGKRRLPGFVEEWQLVKMGDIAKRVSEKNNGQSNNVVTISGKRGLIRQTDFFNKSVASETLDGYTILRKGQFAYNKSYSDGYPMGAIKRLNLYDDAVVTSLYICFEVQAADACEEFMEHYFESGVLNRGLKKVAAEGGRAHGLLNVKPSDFFDLRLLLPPKEEQKAIAKVLSQADAEIEAQQRRLDCLRQEKKALMQQLLTGKRRVKLRDEAA